jgi:hypothetical protein
LRCCLAVEAEGPVKERDPPERARDDDESEGNRSDTATSLATPAAIIDTFDDVG